MKYKVLGAKMLLSIVLVFFLPVSSSAVEIAPRISDREIIEKLEILEAGVKSLEAGQKSLRMEMESFQKINNLPFSVFGLKIFI